MRATDNTAARRTGRGAGSRLHADSSSNSLFTRRGYRRLVRERRTVVPLVLACAVALVLAAAGSATTVYSDRLAGTEVVPVSSTHGTFVGAATGELPALWRVEITHQPLATGSTVAVTGGSFMLLTRSAGTLSGPVTGGSVTVTNRGRHCTSQTYRVVATLGIGSFDGTLTHHRRSLLGRCVVYAATIVGRALLSA